VHSLFSREKLLDHKDAQLRGNFMSLQGEQLTNRNRFILLPILLDKSRSLVDGSFVVDSRLYLANSMTTNTVHVHYSYTPNTHSYENARPHPVVLSELLYTLQVWRVVKHELIEVPRSVYGVFCGGECYVIQYTYAAKSAENKNYIIYFWQVRERIPAIDKVSADTTSVNSRNISDEFLSTSCQFI
jgi:hypothetical protein